MTVATEMPAPSVHDLEVMWQKSMAVYFQKCKLPPMKGCPCSLCTAGYAEARTGTPSEIRIRPEAKRLWIEALRSGQFTQIRDDWGGGSRRCAMSVLLAVLDIPVIARADRGIRAKMLTRLGVDDWQLDYVTSAVIGMNDRELLSFDEIADRIERDY